MLRLNHIELTVRRGFVADDGDRLTAFFADVFGFRRNVFPGLDTAHLVLASDDEASQFLFVCETDAPAHLPGDDHLGFHFDSEAEVDAALAKCRAWAALEPKVEIRPFDDLRLEHTVTRSFYVRYLLPIWLDVQHIRARPGFEPARQWRFAAITDAQADNKQEGMMR